MVVETRASLLRRKAEGVSESEGSAHVVHSTGKRRYKGITIGTLNIVDGRGNRLELACRELQRHGVDIAVVTETKLCGFHTVSSFG